MDAPGWYLLIHQLPERPLYLRAKIRTRLARVGAVALKNSVYLLPRRERALPELQGIAAEVVAGGGEAFVCAAEFAEPRSSETLVKSFQEARNADYGAFAAQARAWGASLRRGGHFSEGVRHVRLERLKRRLEEIGRIDFFGAPARREAEAVFAALERELEAVRTLGGRTAGKRNADLVGRTWVTRRGVQIDRIASGWFIRRFIDADARFRFLDPHAVEVRPRELRFDMADGDFTHEGDRCTLETLIVRTGVEDPALARVAEIVHDIDIKDGKFGRAEADGIERLLLGVLAANPEDPGRFERGFALLDDLYQSFRRPTREPSGTRAEPSRSQRRGRT